MTWTQLHERMAFMDDLIDRATENSADAALQFINDQFPNVERLFGTEDGLFLSLQHRWTTMLVAELDQADYEGVPVEHVLADLNASQRGLRVLLDTGATRSPCLRALQHDEPRIVELFGGLGVGVHRDSRSLACQTAGPAGESGR